MGTDKKRWPMSGVFGRNQRKQSDSHPDLTGSAEVDGKDYYMSIWRKVGPDGSEFFTMSFRPKDTHPVAEKSTGYTRVKEPPQSSDFYDDGQEAPF